MFSVVVDQTLADEPRSYVYVAEPDHSPIECELGISAVPIAELEFGVLVTDNPDARAIRMTRLSFKQRLQSVTGT